MSGQNKKANKKKLLIAAAIAGLLLATSAFGFIFRDRLTQFSGPIPALAEDNRPKFIFDSADFPDWASFGSTWVETASDNSESYEAILLSQCKSGSSCSGFVDECRSAASEENPACKQLEALAADGCMVQAYYFKNTINPDTAVADELAKWGNFGANAEEVGVKSLAMSTLEGSKEYQFHQYDSHVGGAYKKGVAFGFIPLSTSHIVVRSTCWEASQLDSTLPALNAIHLEA